MTKLTVASADSSETGSIDATSWHPVWVDSQDKFVAIGDLKPNDRLMSLDGSQPAVAGVQRYSHFEPVYDLTIEGVHTYYVVAASTSVLVHNCGTAGEATVHWDPDEKHAQISVATAYGKTVKTEQVITGYGPDGGAAGGPTTGSVATSMVPNAVSIRIPLPNATGARKEQIRTLGSDLGPYGIVNNSCVTYCVNILVASGVEMPSGVRGAVWLKRRMQNGG